MSAYRELDEAIVEYIQRNPGKHPIYSWKLSEMAAKELGVVDSHEKVWRLIDRRLQALKKAGRIAFVRPQRRWVAL